MRRTILLLAGVLLCVVALGSDSPKEYDDRTEADIEGTWRLVEAEHGGKQIETDPKIVDTYRSGAYTIDDGNGNPWRGTYCIDTTRKPSHLDRFYANGAYKGKTRMFIYQIDGDTLRIAGFPGNRNERPRRFHGEGVIVEIYKRVK